MRVFVHAAETGTDDTVSLQFWSDGKKKWILSKLKSLFECAQEIKYTPKNPNWKQTATDAEWCYGALLEEGKHQRARSSLTAPPVTWLRNIHFTEKQQKHNKYGRIVLRSNEF